MRLLPRSAKSTLLMSQFRGVAVVDILLLWRFMRGKYLDHLVAGWPVQCLVLRQEYTNFKERVRYFRCSVGVSLSAPSGWHFGESQTCWCHPERKAVFQAERRIFRAAGYLSPTFSPGRSRSYLRMTCPAGSRNPASLARFAALSVAS